MIKWQDYIVSTPGVLNGKPRLKDTRIPAALILGYLADGYTYEQIAKEYDGKAIIGKVDVDNNPQIAQKYGIRNIPTILFIKGGEVVDP